MKLVTIIGSGTIYGRTAQNNTLTELLVFRQTLSTSKASYSGRYPSGTPQGRTQKIHIFPQGSNNENELHYLIHFIHPEFLEIYYLHCLMLECGILNSRIKNKHLTTMNKDPSVPTRKILRTMILLKHYLL